jgi:hypothetical protein
MKKIFILFTSVAMLVALSAFQPKNPKKPVKKAKPATSATTPGTAVPVKPATKVELSDKAYDVKFDRTFHDFGTAKEGEQVETTFILTNIGTEPVIIQTHTVECGCTTPSYPKEPIMPGKSATIKVGFNTAGKMGNNTKNVTLTTNGGSHILSFKCQVTEKAKVDPIEPGIIIKPN